ncbi:MAG: NAD(P)-dependent alcohol dehydrogenase [Rhodobacteraceae bacterium]|jgi:NADPH:quinone reductase-like Zn-dependent oxidoreductase|uniref:Zn-dependent oxidoreductase, NADPH:quinone reductase n=1 Tax=Salipiger profundus TaxID=1229727 RepID=A0A1U7D8A9_9RHOB|nr:MULTISPECIES: NAD(P)-dependent alcohol dehydrogenase [Salipiger]APX24363.1 Zn-dependent oxidoreductase, NADPH:quinone reductase [Salipiger profundus]MAB07333.1 NAD(P)-dependent alcohol dehydrogenase [Paracoccaceae bacterium]GGA19412.1 alcohol dehydrogenase [Salipiger profundus]SFD36501.1 NADPH:quinone reductase [Salipiger profundus]
MRQISIKAPGGLDNLVLSDAPEAEAPKAGEITVRLHATSLNFHDYMVASRENAAADGRIPMADGAGEVTAVGDGVTDVGVGDRVVSCFFPDWQDGAFRPSDFSRVPGDGLDGYARESVTLPASWVTHAPEGWSHAEAATITTAGLTAWRALVVDGGLKPGDTVAVLGTGGVSIYALQIAKAMGARVIATSSSDAKLERLRELGADHVINYRDTPEWGAEMQRLTGGRGVDIVVEVGGPATLEQSITAGRPGAHLALIGILTGISGEIPTANLMRKQQRLQGLIVGSRKHQQDFVAALETLAIRPVVDRTFDLADLADAFRLQESGDHFGKICVTM